MQPAIVFCDIDDTLLAPGQILLPKVAGALRGLARLGVPLCFASGRVPADIRPLQRQIGGETLPAVACNGALIFEGKRLEVVAPLPLGQLGDWLDEAVCAGFTVLYTLGDAEYCHCETFGSSKKRLQRGQYHPIRLLNQADAPALTKLNLINDRADAATVQAWDRRLRGLDGVAVTRYGQRGFELTSNRVSKATGIRLILASRGLEPEASLCIGDNENDVEMLDLAGVAAVVANATKTARSHADFQSQAAGQLGVLEILLRYFPHLSEEIGEEREK